MKTIKVRDVIDGKTVVTETHDPECAWCEHDCPWNRLDSVMGAPYCPVCDDHGEAQHAGFGDIPCTCGDEGHEVWRTTSDDYTGPTFREMED